MLKQTKVNAAPVDAKKLSPELQKKFDMFIINGMEIIHDQKTSDGFLKRIGTNPEPTKAIAEILVDIVVRLTDSAQQAGQEIPPEIVLHGSNLLLGEIVGVLEASGLETLSEEQKTGIWQIAVSLYLDQAIKSGKMTEQELKELKAEVEKTEAGKKVLKTAEDPATAIKGLKPPGGQIVNDLNPAQSQVPSKESAVPGMGSVSAQPVAASTQGGV